MDSPMNIPQIPSINPSPPVLVDVTPPEESSNKVLSSADGPMETDQKKPNAYSLSTHKLGNKSLGMLPPPSSQVTKSVPPSIPLNKLPPPSLLPSSSDSAGAASAASQMATLSAPAPAMSSVYTANKPKSSLGGLTPPVNNLLQPTGSATGECFFYT